MTSGVSFQPDAIEAILNYVNKDVNSCDVCGGKATVMTFEFMASSGKSTDGIT